MTEPAPLPAAAPAPEPPPAPPPVADGVERRLDPRSIRVARIAGWLFAGPVLAVLAGALTLVLSQASLPGWARVLIVVAGSAAALVLAWSAQRWPAIEHRHAFYKVDARGIEIRRGVWWRTETHVPRSRVQHTDVSQGPLQRSHGLATLVIYTAGTEHAKVELSGLDQATALRIRDHLLAGEGDDAV